MRRIRLLRVGGLFLGLATGCAGLGGCGGGEAKTTGTQVAVDEKEQQDIERASEEFHEQNQSRTGEY
jgi:hypothetical protein